MATNSSTIGLILGTMKPISAFCRHLTGMIYYKERLGIPTAEETGLEPVKCGFESLPRYQLMKGKEMSSDPLDCLHIIADIRPIENDQYQCVMCKSIFSVKSYIRHLEYAVKALTDAYIRASRVENNVQTR